MGRVDVAHRKAKVMTTTTVLLLSDGYFQQDYVQGHKVHAVSNCFLEQENNPQSPDLNPVDHV